MKKLPRALRAAGVAVAAAAALLAIASLPWRGAPEPGPAAVLRIARGAGPLRAGAAEVRLGLPPGVPIAGFARLSYRSDGVRDPPGVRALVLSEPGCRVALASVDLLLVPGALDRAVRARVADLGLDGLVLAATHTHAGPGGYWDDLLGERLATGAYDAAIEARLADAVAGAIRAAAAAEVPARVAWARDRLEGFVRNRDGGDADARLDVLRVEREDGSPVAEVVVFASHATLLGKANRLLSGDWPARLPGALPGVPLLFFQGAGGDQSARLPGGGPSGPDAYGDAVRERVAAVRPGPAAPDPALAFAQAEAPLPAPSPGAVPAPLRRAAANLLFRRAATTARVAAVRIGPVLLVAVPAEPVAAVGAAWRAAAGDGAVIVSLAGDYLGYAETPERVAAGEGESARSYYGPELAGRIGGAVEAASRAIAPAP